MVTIFYEFENERIIAIYINIILQRLNVMSFCTHHDKMILCTINVNNRVELYARLLDKMSRP